MTDTLLQEFLDLYDEGLPEEFEHYGVPGMKWGVRRSRAQLARAAAARGESSSGSGSSSSSGESKSSGSSETTTERPRLSDDELRGRINRIKLEREYKSLTAPQKSKGRQIVENLVMDVAVNSVKSAATAKATHELKKLFKAPIETKKKSS